MYTRSRRASVLLCLLFALFAAGWADAESTVEQVAADSPSSAQLIPDRLQSPKATMETFLSAMKAARQGDDAQIEQAVSTLDLTDVNPLVRAEKGADLVWMLQEVMSRTRVPDTKHFPTRTSGRPFVVHTYEAGEVAIVFKAHEGWRFSAETVAVLPAILDELARTQKADGTDVAQMDEHLPFYLRLRDRIPGEFKQQTLILEQWQWLAILIIILVGLVLDKVISVMLGLVVRFWRKRVARGSFRELSDSILRPFGLMAMAFVWWAGLNMLGVPASVLVVLLISVKFVACVSTVWGAYRLVDLLGAFLLDSALRTDTRIDDALVPLMTKTVKLFVTVMGVVFIADNLDVDVTSLLAGLGLGGLAFALAAKDVAGNLFGSITVLLDQTFHVGDWVVIGDIEGTVEYIGFRSTRIRTFYNSLVSVPNSRLITASVDNMGARSYRRLSCKLSIAYDTPPERIEAFCEGIREIVRLHPYMRKDYYQVYLNGFGAAALEILVYVFWQTPEWSTELRERHRFLLDCLRLAKRLGVEYAYPTQTLYLKQTGVETAAPAGGKFQSEVSRDEALALGREEAKVIVEATTGLGAVPPPVTIGASGSAHDDA